MRTSLLIGLSSLIGLSGCATGSTVERCQAAAAKHGVILEDFGPSTTELLVDAEMLTGALLGAVATKDANAKEGWRKAGAGFFQRGARKPATGPDRGSANDAAPNGDAASA